MAEPGITFEQVWKKFRRGERHDSLRDLIPAIGRRLLGRGPKAEDLGEKEFWAVRDVSFDVKPGGALGIIGPNGAGKSTILKLLTRIIKPTKGRCAVKGRVGALIEVAAGFHPDLTGRENVFLQGAIMGMSRVEVARKFDEIVEFAGVSEFIDTPVKRYSSGMNARLGFAVAAHLDPEVLIIDEVLSVGDSGFQNRCLQRMRKMLDQGVPLVFVSHHLQSIQDLCKRVLVVGKGKVVFDGEPAKAIHEYRRMVWSPPADDPAGAAGKTDARILGVRLFNTKGEPAEWFRTLEGMTVRILYDALKPLKKVHFAVEVHRGDGVYCYGINSNFDQLDLGPLEGRGHVELRFPRLNLLPGYYTLSVGLLDGDGMGAHDVHHLAYPFSVEWDRRDFGVTFLDHEWVRPVKTPEAAPEQSGELAASHTRPNG